MKRGLILFLAAALAFVGCKKEVATGVQGGDQTVTFSVVADNAATKADVTNIPETIDTCVAVVRMYDAHDVLINDIYASPKCTKDGQSYKFSVDLMGGQKYEVTVLLYTKNVYTVDPKLEAIQRAAAELPYNLHAEHDLFSASITYSAGDDTPLIIAKRPFAQLNLITTDLVQNFEPAVTVKYTAPDTFNAVTGEASGERVYETLGVVTSYDYAPNQCTISSDYIFASDEKSLISVEMKAEKVGTFVRTFDNLPLQRNYKTNVIGKLLTVDAPFTVQVNADWYTPANDIQWQNAENIAAANAILADAPAGKDLNIKVNMPKDAAAQKITFTTKNSNTNTTFKFENNFASESTADKTITFTKDADATVMPASVTIEAPAGTHLVFEKETHAVINGTEYASISGSFTVSTLVINKGVHVGTIDMTAGGLEIHGTVDHFIAHEGHGEIIVRDCEGLSEEVYNALKGFVDPAYTVNKKGETYDIFKNVVAMVGEKEFSTVVNAVRAAAEGATVKLVKDCMMGTMAFYGETNSIGFYIGKNLTLDLNGCTLSNTSNFACIWTTDSKKLTITDSSDNISGVFNFSGRYPLVYNSGSIGKPGYVIEVDKGNFNYNVTDYVLPMRVCTKVGDLYHVEEGAASWTDQLVLTPAVEGTDYSVSGSEYTIHTALGLAWMGTSNNSFEGKTVKLSADIDLYGKRWDPVSARFLGVFDGQNHSIKNAVVPNRDYGSAFFNDMSGKCQDVVFDNVVVGDSSNGNVAGVVAGYAYGNVAFSNITVKNSTVYGFGKVGAILGMAADPGQSTTTKVLNCKVIDSQIVGVYNVAGLVGLVQNKIDISGSTTDGVTVSGDPNETYVDLDTSVESVTFYGLTYENEPVKGSYWVYNNGQYYFAGLADLYNIFVDDATTVDGKSVDGFVHNK